MGTSVTIGLLDDPNLPLGSDEAEQEIDTRAAEVSQWLSANAKGRWQRGGLQIDHRKRKVEVTFSFDNDRDAALFRIWFG